MEKAEVLSRLRPIARSAQAPVLSEFGDQARDIAQKMRGNSRAAFVMERAASKAAEPLVRVTWQSMQAALDQTRLEWAPATQRDLEVVLSEVVREGAAPLRNALDVYKDKDPNPGRSASEALSSSIDLHLEGAKSFLAFYVDGRRRLEVLSVLCDLEVRLFEEDPSGGLLARARIARQQTQNANTNDDELKQTLEVLAQGLPAVVAAHDIGIRLAEVITWLRA